MVAKVPMVLVAARPLGVDSLEALVRLARSQPGRYSFSSAGNGTSGHVAGQCFCNVAGLDATHVPYRGSARP